MKKLAREIRSVARIVQAESLGQKIKTAVRRNDIKTIADIVEGLTMKYRITYKELADMFKRQAGLDAGDFEALMQEVDAIQSSRR